MQMQSVKRQSGQRWLQRWGGCAAAGQQLRWRAPHRWQLLPQPGWRWRRCDPRGGGGGTHSCASHNGSSSSERNCGSGGRRRGSHCGGDSYGGECSSQRDGASTSSPQRCSVACSAAARSSVVHRMEERQLDGLRTGGLQGSLCGTERAGQRWQLQRRQPRWLTAMSGSGVRCDG